MKDVKHIKYPKSKSGMQCVGPCYKPNTYIMHPITLEYITDKNNIFCPVQEWHDTSPDGITIHITDVCAGFTYDKNKDTADDIETNIIVPYIDFNKTHFLKIYYNI